MSRKNAYRRRNQKRGLAKPLLGLAVLGATAAATAALGVAYRRGHLDGLGSLLGLDPEFDPGRIGGELFSPAPRLQDLALWLPGPAGNLFVRDGGAGGAHDLPLRYFIYGVDVIEALDALSVALMHGIDPQESGTPLRIGPAPLADGHRGGTSVLIGRVLLAVAEGFA